MKHWFAAAFTLVVLGSIRADLPDKHPGKTPAEAKQTRQDLVKQLKEKLGSAYKVLDAEHGDDIEIHSLIEFYYTVAVINAESVDKSPPRGETRIINIHLMPDIDLSSYQKFRAESEKRDKACEAWRKKLSSIKKLPYGAVPPSHSQAQALLDLLQPETKKERLLVEQYQKFVEVCEKDERAMPPLPSHQFGGSLYYLYSISYELHGQDKATVETVEHAVEEVLKKLE